MLRKLLRSTATPALSIQQYSRVAEFKQYLCLREALNKEASEKASADFKALSEKYKLNSKELIDLFVLLGNNPNDIHKYLSFHESAFELEEIETIWRNSKFYNSKPFDQAYAELKQKYQDVSLYTQNQDERKKALEDLESIFFPKGIKNFTPGDDLTATRMMNAINKNLRAHVAKLRATNATTSQGISAHTGEEQSSQEIVAKIIQSLEKVFQILEIEPASTLARIQRFLESYKPSQVLTTESNELKSRDGKSLA